MSNAVLWFGSLPAIMGVAVFVLGCYFAFRRHKKGGLKLKLPVIGELSTETLSVAFIALAFPFLLTAHNVYVKERELAAAEEAARQAAEAARQATSLITYATAMPGKDRVPLFKSIASSMRREVATIGPSSGAKSIAALDRMEAAANLLLAIDPENGHGIYFLGEAFRLRRASDSEVRFHGQFRKYVSVACRKSKRSFTNKTNADACYDSGDGYCAERIAWVLHLLANSYYRDALASTNAGNRQVALQTALRDADAVLQIWGKPFVHPAKSEQVSTAVIRDFARAELKAPVSSERMCP